VGVLNQPVEDSLPLAADSSMKLGGA
jgi:hypothetical protein